MSDPVPDRVRVTAPTRSPTRRRPTASRLEDSVRVEDIYVRSLVRAQLRLAGRTLGLLAVLVGGLPLLFWVRPGLAGISLLGVPLAWLLLGVLVYPLLLALGWRYLHHAELNERAVADLVRRGPDEPAVERP